MATNIHPGFNPYTFVRTNVMRSKLLKQEDYHKLMKMGVSEITKYLQDREYREDIVRLGVHETGISLIDQALSDNLERSFKKLRRISDDSLLPLIDAYLLRHEVWNIKTVLRAVYTDADREEVKRMLLFTESLYPEEFYDELLAQTSLEDALKIMRRTRFKDALAGADSLMLVENSLDTHYYSHLIERAESLSKGAALYKRYLVTEVEISNILTVIRLKADGLPPEEIDKQLVRVPISRLDRLFSKLVEARSIEEVVELCRRTAYRENMERGLKEYKQSESLLEMERQLKKYLLRISERLLHQDLLSFNTIIGYMLAKEYEIKNLRTLIKGKALGIDDAFIEEELLVV